VEKVWSASVFAYIGELGEKLCPACELFVIGGLHILRAPPEVPHRGCQLPRRRVLDLVEQNPCLLPPDPVEQSGELAALAIKLACVERNCRRRIGRIQMDVMKVCDGRRVRRLACRFMRRWQQGAQRQGDNAHQNFHSVLALKDSRSLTYQTVG